MGLTAQTCCSNGLDSERELFDGNERHEDTRCDVHRQRPYGSRMTSKITALFFLCLALSSCGDDDDDGRGGNPSGVGNYCESDADCATGECYLGPGGGYCTSPCSDEGDTSACPLDTICKPIQGGARRCLLVCGSETSCGKLEGCADSYCPTGSSCVSISGSALRACEPNPE